MSEVEMRWRGHYYAAGVTEDAAVPRRSQDGEDGCVSIIY